MSLHSVYTSLAVVQQALGLLGSTLMHWPPQEASKSEEPAQQVTLSLSVGLGRAQEAVGFRVVRPNSGTRRYLGFESGADALGAELG